MTRRLSRRATAIALALAIGLALLGGVLGACGGDDPEPLRIGIMLVNDEAPSQTALDRLRAAKLAIQHVTDAGGVFGVPVEVAVSLDWDERGDLTRGYIGIWRFTSEDTIEDVDSLEYEN